MAIPFITIMLDKPRKIRLGMSSMIEFEEITGVKIQSLTNEAGFKTYAQLLWVMLKNEDDTLTLKDTITLVDDYSDIPSVMKAITDTMTVATNGAGASPNAKPPITKK